MEKSRKYAWPIIIFIFLLATFLSTLTLLKQRQEVRKRAFSSQGQAFLELSPQVGRYHLGEDVNIGIFFISPDIPISAVALRLTYFPAGEVTFSNLQISQNLLAEEDWVCPVKSISSEGDIVKIDISCVNVNPGGYISSTPTLLGSFELKVIKSPSSNPLKLRFDPDLSVITRKSDGQDILQQPSDGVYYIESLECPQKDKGNLSCDSVGKINEVDLTILLSKWKTAEGDLNGDSVTNEEDLQVLLLNWDL